MAEQDPQAVADEHDGDPWAVGPVDPRPWCEVCEGSHASHAKWLAGSAEAVAGWSESAKALEAALDESRSTLSHIRYAKAGPGEPADEDACGIYREMARLVARLRRITDSAAWQRAQEAAGAASEEARDA